MATKHTPSDQDRDQSFEPETKRPRVDTEAGNDAKQETNVCSVGESVQNSGDDQTSLTDENTVHNKSDNDSTHKRQDSAAVIETDTQIAKGKNIAVDVEKIMTELDVGITEYISKHEGFNGILKQRYSDFIVNEIDVSGNVVHLTDISKPVFEDEKEEKTSSSEVLSKEDISKLEQLVESGNKNEVVILQVPNDKEERTKIYAALRQEFPALDGNTCNDNKKKIIKVSLKKGKGNRDQRRTWPKNRGDYLRFVLYKENKDTMQAIQLISKLLRIKAGAFTYAGTKDRRGKTTQEISIYRGNAEKIHSLKNTLRQMAVGNFRYCKEQLRLGDLKGNQFNIVLRNVTGKEEQISAAIESLKTHGFINYFGMQRFGTTSIPTYYVGKCLIHSDWEGAVELLLKPRQTRYGDPSLDEFNPGREVWWETRDPKKALEKITKYSIEKTILQALIKCGNKNYLSAIQMLPRNTQMMYVHSYQSYVWNTIVSKRIKEYGLQPVEGDLVLENDTCDTVEDPNEEESRKEGNPTPTVIDKDNISNFTIHDVVLPLPGHDVLYPSNTVGTWYKEMLDKDGIETANMKHKIKTFSMYGRYRKILIKPSNVSWSIHRYDDVTEQLSLSDFDLLNGVNLPEEKTDGKFQALKVEFQLPAACYATMAIREILKTDTSSAHQSTLNVD